MSEFQNRMCAVSGGAMRDRTADLLRARQALSQLSYGPSNFAMALPPLIIALKMFAFAF